MNIKQFGSSDIDDFTTMASDLWPHHSRDELAKEFLLRTTGGLLFDISVSPSPEGALRRQCLLIQSR